MTIQGTPKPCLWFPPLSDLTPWHSSRAKQNQHAVGFSRFSLSRKRSSRAQTKLSRKSEASACVQSFKVIFKRWKSIRAISAHLLILNPLGWLLERIIFLCSFAYSLSFVQFWPKWTVKKKLRLYVSFQRSTTIAPRHDIWDVSYKYLGKCQEKNFLKGIHSHGGGHMGDIQRGSRS